MALIECRECKQQVSDTARVCPSCGSPVRSQNSVRRAILLGLFMLAAALLAAVIPLLIFLP